MDLYFQRFKDGLYIDNDGNVFFHPVYKHLIGKLHDDEIDIVLIYSTCDQKTIDCIEDIRKSGSTTARTRVFSNGFEAQSYDDETLFMVDNLYEFKRKMLKELRVYKHLQNLSSLQPRFIIDEELLITMFENSGDYGHDRFDLRADFKEAYTNMLRYRFTYEPIVYSITEFFM